MLYLYHGKGRNPEPVAAGMAAEKAGSAGLEPLRASRTRKPHDTGLTLPESDGTASERRADRKASETAWQPERRTARERGTVKRMKYNLSDIMHRAWGIFRKAAVTFAEALHRAWMSAKAEPINAQRIEAAKAAAGIIEECRTWSDWKALGREVIHGSKALFSAALIWGSRGDGAIYKASFFGLSQTSPVG